MIRKTLGPFLEKLVEIGLPIILGMWPLASYRNALFLNNEVPGVVIPEIVLRRMEGIQDKETARQEGRGHFPGNISKSSKAVVQGIQVSPPFITSRTALEVVEGAKFVLVIIASVVPGVLWGVFLWLQDRYEKEPVGKIIARLYRGRRLCLGGHLYVSQFFPIPGSLPIWKLS
jgi:hypothetical protein